MKTTSMKNIRKQLMALAVLAISLIACRQQQPLIIKADIEPYLMPTSVNLPLEAINEELVFWNDRMQVNSEDFVSAIKAASLHSSRFAYSGDVQDLLIAEKLYTSAIPFASIKSSGIYRSMAQLNITMHKFKEAEVWLSKAANMGDDLYITNMMQFDVFMELGKTREAKQILAKINDPKSFNYLIRNAKYEDHVLGNLEAAISNMEMAKATLTDSTNDQYLWAESNLADMYMHDGQPEKALSYYKLVLAKNAQYYHALKGIAWLAFSYDKNDNLASDIISYLQIVHPVPDYDLELAEIAAFTNNTAKETMYLNKFIAAVGNPGYGNMYNKYLFDIYTNKLENLTAANTILQKEVANRPTPEVYSWQAWYEYKMGNNAASLGIIKDKVEGKCFEPSVLYTIGSIYKHNNNTAKSKTYFKEVSEAALETGPLVHSEVLEQLKTL